MPRNRLLAVLVAAALGSAGPASAAVPDGTPAVAPAVGPARSVAGSVCDAFGGSRFGRPPALDAACTGVAPQVVQDRAAQPRPPARTASAVGVQRSRATAASASDWAVASTPNKISEDVVDFLAGTTCVTASDCWAVGDFSMGRYTGGVVLQTLIEHWDGSAWTIVPSPNATQLQINSLADVTCVTTEDCWAVGTYSNGRRWRTLAEHWDGTSWSLVTTPNTGDDNFNQISGVTCLSSTYCLAAGYSATPTNTYTLMLEWDGVAWSIVETPNGVQSSLLSSSPYDASVLYDVTCVAASECWAVGTYFQGMTFVPLVLRWDGSAWGVVDAPSLGEAGGHDLYSVTCVAAGDCWAVGKVTVYEHYQSLILHWDGSEWAVAPSVNAPGENAVYAVTCAATDDCWAAGSVYPSSAAYMLQPAGIAPQTVLQHWDGTLWTRVASPNRVATQPSSVSGVACVSGASCWAVGWAGGAAFHTLAMRWDGAAWAIVTSPDESMLADNFLTDVACTTTSSCWAVGYELSGIARQTMVQRWDGASWSIVPSPNTVTTVDNELLAVTCTSATSCWAVGQEWSTGAGWSTLTLRWDGAAWAIVPSAQVAGATSNALQDVTCVSASDCWAVGWYTSSFTSPPRTLVEHWNGVAWSIVTSPNAALDRSMLNGIACESATACWAVGRGWTSADEPLVERWDGTAWSVVASSLPVGSDSASLAAVTCSAVGDCWAVGGSAVGDAARPLVQRWDGTAWAAADVAALPAGTLSAVTCAATSDCRAVGSAGAAPVVASWDGGSWSASAPPATNGALTGVSCPTPSGCWAVGSRNTGLIGQTLAAGYGDATADQEPVIPEAPYLPLLLLGGVFTAAIVLRRPARG